MLAEVVNLPQGNLSLVTIVYKYQAMALQCKNASGFCLEIFNLVVNISLYSTGISKIWRAACWT